MTDPEPEKGDAVNMQSTEFALPSADGGTLNPTSKELSIRPRADAKEESESRSDGSNRGFALKMVACLAVVILAVQVRAVHLFMLASSYRSSCCRGWILLCSQ